MWKWVTLLCVGMYGTLMLFGGEGYTPEESAALSVAPQVNEPQPEPVAVSAPEVVVSEPEVIIAQPEIIAPEPEVVAVVEPVEELPTPSQPATVEVTSSAIRPIAPVATPTPIREQLVTDDAPVVETVAVETAPTTAPAEIWRVTGSRVNLRAAATTQARIVGRTVRGDSAEIIELLPNGWAKVYIIDSGIEAFMSASFIAPEG